jgi:hypothetical protein
VAVESASLALDHLALAVLDLPEVAQLPPVVEVADHLEQVGLLVFLMVVLAVHMAAALAGWV